MPAVPPSRLAANAGPTQARAPMRLCLLADDLTGACDAAVAFAACGLNTEVSLRKEAIPGAGAEVWARCTHTRDVDSAQVAATLGSELAQLPPCEAVFKKIDSVFRGNTFDEIAAVRQLLPGMSCLLAPAFPALGRTSRNGILRILDVSGERSLDVVAQLRRRGVPLEVIPAGLPVHECEAQFRRYWRKDSPVVFCDAELQEHLQVVVEAARKTRASLLWVGSAGLAHALGASLCEEGAAYYPPRSVRGGRVVFFVGSNHPVTLAQVKALHTHTEILPPDAAVVVKISRGCTSAREIQAAVADLDAENTACLFMTGGDTAAMVCEALGMQALRLEREFAPGLPEGLAIGGRFEGVPVLLKSGGFGTGEVLCEIARTFSG